MDQTGNKSLIFFVAAMALIGLYIASSYSYLLFHMLAELFSVIIASSMFMIAWNSRKFMNNHYLLLLGIAYFFVGGLDLIHTMAYKGMHLLNVGDSTNVAAQFWIAARSVESLSLLASPFLMRRRLNVDLVLTIYSTVFLLLVLSITYWKIFPACFTEAHGLTAFKKTMEYLICIVLLVAAALIIRQRADLDSVVLRWLIASIALTITSEITFTEYARAYDITNLIGHYLKILSFYCIYRAIIQTGLNNPYTVMFFEMKRSQEALERARQHLEDKVAERTTDLQATVNELSEEVKKRMNAEKMLRQLSRKTIDTLENDRKSVAKELHDSIGASLAAIKFLLEGFLENMVKRKQWEPQQIERVIKYLGDTIRETKRISARLRPLILEELGLLSTIKEHARRFSELYGGIDINLRMTAREEDIPDSLKIVIYRILQEGLNNVGKHSQATNVDIALRAAPQGIVFELTDNGIGFQHPHEDKPSGLSGYGLQSMRERAEIIGGQFTATSVANQGVQIIVELPLTPSQFDASEPLRQE